MCTRPVGEAVRETPREVEASRARLTAVVLPAWAMAVTGGGAAAVEEEETAVVVMGPEAWAPEKRVGAMEGEERVAVVRVKEVASRAVVEAIWVVGGMEEAVRMAAVGKGAVGMEAVETEAAGTEAADLAGAEGLAGVAGMVGVAKVERVVVATGLGVEGTEVEVEEESGAAETGLGLLAPHKA